MMKTEEVENLKKAAMPKAAGIQVAYWNLLTMRRKWFRVPEFLVVHPLDRRFCRELTLSV